jgi:hypothetical protein
MNGQEIKREQIEAILRVTPGPSPWYLQGRGPIINTKFGATLWEDAGSGPVTAGKTILHTEQKRNLAIFDFQYWISSFGGKFLLSWNQPYQFERWCSTSPVTIRLYDPNLFVPFDSLEEVCNSMKAEKRTVYQQGGEILSFEIPTIVTGEVRKHVFPEPISKIEELLIPCHSSGIVYDGVGRQNCGLLVARPSQGNFEIVPQDWFNTANLDFGYQWVTQFARYPLTGKIIGGGIRLSYFVLSDDFRQVDQWIR